MAEREAVSCLRPVGEAELERAAALVGERLGPKLPFGVARGRAFARAALDKGRGLTDGSAVALLDPPGAATPVSPERRRRRRARRQGDAWLYGVAKPVGDPPRSATPLLEGLARYLDHEGWACSLVTTVPALVPRYEAFGFVEIGRWRNGVALRRGAAGSGRHPARHR